MDSLVPNGCKIVNTILQKILFSQKNCLKKNILEIFNILKINVNNVEVAKYYDT